MTSKFLAFILIIFSGLSAMALDSSIMPSTYQRKVLVSVGDFQEPDRLFWKKEICTRIHLIANQINQGGVDIVCRQFDTGSFVDKALPELRHKYHYHVRVLRSKNGELQMDVSNWNRTESYDFESVGWIFPLERNNERRQEEALAKVTANFFYFAANERAFKKGVVINAIKESKYITYDTKKGQFRDALTNEVITLDRALSLFKNENPRFAKYLRAALEIGASLSAGLANHYWDFDSSNISLPEQLSIYTGSLADPTKIGSHSLEIFLMSLATGAQWDHVEYRDALSVNLITVSPLTKYLLLEARAQQDCSLAEQSKKKSLCTRKFWSNLSSQLGLTKGQAAFDPTKNPTFISSLNTEIIDLNKYNAQSEEAKLLIDTAMLKLMMKSRGQNTWRELRILANVVARTQRQRYAEGKRGSQLESYDLNLDFSDASLTQSEREELDKENQALYGKLDFLGATARANMFFENFTLQVEFGLHGDVAMVKSYAISEVGSAFNNSLPSGYIPQSRREQYYWGYGTSTLAAIAAVRGKFKVGYEWRSSQSSDVHIKELGQIDPYGRRDIEDNADSHKIFIRYRMYKNLSFQVAFENIHRTGSIGDGRPKSVNDNRVMGTLQFTF